MFSFSKGEKNESYINKQCTCSYRTLFSGICSRKFSDFFRTDSKVVKTTCFLADMADFATFNSVYEKYFTSKPARSCVAVKTLPKNVLCEIEAIAEL